jgi:thymidine phosphorylase
MKKTIAVVVISLGLSVGALADDKTYTIQDTMNTVGQIPVKVAGFISKEIDKTKEFQKANWEKVKTDWSKLIAKFSSQ